MASAIPPFYRTFFTTIDPIFAFSGILLPISAPNSYLKTFSQDATTPPATETRACLDMLAGWFTACFFLQVFLLRARPNDVTVWCFLQAAILITDIAMLAGLTRALNDQYRLPWSLWRVVEAGNVLVTALVAVIRLAFLMGIGVRGDGLKRA